MNLIFSSQNLQNFFLRNRNFFLYCFLRPRSCPRPPDSLASLIVSPVTRSGGHRRFEQRIVALPPGVPPPGRGEVGVALPPPPPVGRDSRVSVHPPLHPLVPRGGG